MARNFNASGDRLTIGSALATNPLTFSCWFRTSSTTATQGLMAITNNSSSNNYAIMRLVTGSKLQGLARNFAVGINLVSSTGSYSTATWTHAAMVVDSSLGVHIYLNGSKDSDTTNSTTANGWNNTSVGDYYNGGWNGGTVADIAWPAIYSDDLTDAEVDQLASGFHPTLVRPDALVDAWDLWGNDSPEPGYRGNSLTVSGTLTKVASPRIFLPTRPSLVVPVASGGATFQPAWANPTVTISGAMA